MDDKELFEQLARGPLTRSGFDDSLREKIHKRIDNPKRRSIRLWYGNWRKTSSAFLLLLVVLFGVWTWDPFSFKESDENKLLQMSEQTSSLTVQSANSELQNETPRSGILIGLRKDITAPNGSTTSSTYRTILVIPQDKVLVIAASGPGIYMPYNQTFWRIDAVPDALGKGLQRIEASPAGRLVEDVPLETPPSSLRRSERLLFAGNRFVSIEQSTMVTELGESVKQTDVWVNNVEQLLPTLRNKNNDTLLDLHYTLAAALGLDQNGSDIEEWTIDRVPGKWVAKQPSQTSSILNTMSDLDLQQIDVPLTEYVLSHDTLALGWDEIHAIEPSATDAFTSPTEDILAVVVDKGIEVYPYKMMHERMKPLRIQTDTNETIIMVQWAMNSYIDSWTKQLNKWIQPTKSTGL
jgi:hypothetical protein